MVFASSPFALLPASSSGREHLGYASRRLGVHAHEALLLCLQRSQVHTLAFLLFGAQLCRLPLPALSHPQAPVALLNLAFFAMQNRCGSPAESSCRRACGVRLRPSRSFLRGARLLPLRAARGRFRLPGSQIFSLSLFLFFFIYLFIYLFLSLCCSVSFASLSLCLSVSLPLCVSVSLSFSPFISLPLCVFVRLCVVVSFCVSVSLYVCLFVFFLSISFFLFLFLFLFFFLSLSFSLSLSLCVNKQQTYKNRQR